MTWDCAQSPDLAWRLAGELPAGETEAGLGAMQESVLLQDESRIRIVLFRSAERPAPRVSKIYRTPLALTWRDLFRYPQAQREFENLQYAFQRGLPVAEPLGFGLSRIPGRDWYSQLTTAYLDGRTLRDLLASRADGREALVGSAGRLLAEMHRAGMVWGTAHSGNFMVGGKEEETLSAFDLPYALCTGRDMTGGRFALYDVWNMAVDFRTQCRLEETLVRVFFEAYASAAGADPASLQAQVAKRRGRKSVFPERLYIRTIRSFRLRPF